MEVVNLPDPEAAAKSAADIVEVQITQVPDSVLGLDTSSSPVGLYEQLIHHHAHHV